jgi:poly(3-hydroxybutyrate) depolymerase
MVNSTADPVNPYEGGLLILVRLPNGKSLGDRGLHMSGLRTARVLARSWERLGVTEVEKDEADDDSLIRQDWRCRDRPVVRLVSMIGEGHHISVPGGS